MSEIINQDYSTLPQRKALAAGRRVFESCCNGWSELVARDEKTGGETWVYRGDISGTIHGNEIGLRRLYPNCLVSRRR